MKSKFVDEFPPHSHGSMHLGNRQFLDMELTELFSVLLFAKAASACLLFTGKGEK